MSVGIDDLLGGEPEPAPRRRKARLTPLGATVRSAIWAALVAGFLWMVVAATGYSVPFLLVFTVCLAVAISWRLGGMLRPEPFPRYRPTPREESGFRAVDKPFADAKRWVDRLDWVRGDGEQFNRALLPAFAALADERLRLRHGITRATHPARAAELLGPRLVDFLDSPKRRAPSHAQLSELVKLLEEL
ncbi:hypothetical protein Lfu02_28200 [Longispora fulva]|uniref:Uncharacterized protein n=1 Tax=Longispora fulva TaxID=619741 RepID=A0A8J7GJX5_9ACTN|nr:hypothetical protein [Longispora fulva]MBG6138955.1 hypothetical protein [Longispora fulva]GIG58448.1 hypothetical protein Lfu02_28200 [Longispora fulva]